MIYMYMYTMCVYIYIYMAFFWSFYHNLGQSSISYVLEFHVLGLVGFREIIKQTTTQAPQEQGPNRACLIFIGPHFGWGAIWLGIVLGTLIKSWWWSCRVHVGHKEAARALGSGVGHLKRDLQGLWGLVLRIWGLHSGRKHGTCKGPF